MNTHLTHLFYVKNYKVLWADLEIVFGTKAFAHVIYIRGTYKDADSRKITH